MKGFPSISLHVGSWVDFKRRKAAVKEPETVAWLRQCLTDYGPYTLVDVGANVGGYSLIACALDAAIRVVAIEPFPPTFLTLCRNVVLNGLSDRIVPLNGMVGEAGEGGVIPLHFHRWRSGVADHPADGPLRLRLAALGTFQLDAVTHQHRTVICKVDVDGAEGHVSAALAPFWQEPRVRSVLIECEPAARARVERALDAAGLRVAARHAKARAGQVNLVADRREPK